MQLFEFLMVLMSIIVGLGMAALLTGVANLLRARRETSYYWVHAMGVATVFLALTQVWWESWSLRTAPEWTYVGLLLMLASPTCLFLMAHLLFPEDRGAAEATDFEAYYFDVARVVFLLAAAAASFGSLFRPVVFGENLFVFDNLSTVPTVLICLTLAVSTRRRVHEILVPTLMVMVFLDIVVINRLIGAG